MGTRDPFDFEGRAPAPRVEPVRAPEPAREGQGGGHVVGPGGGPGGGTGGGAPVFDRLPRGAAGPPAGWLVAALVVALAATVGALLLGADIGVAFLCWVLAGPAAIGLIAVFVLRDTLARSRPLYIRPPWMTPLRVVTVLAVVVGIAAGAWRIADWWGRL